MGKITFFFVGCLLCGVLAAKLENVVGGGCSAILLSCKSDARHYEIPKFDNDALALELVDNKLDQHSFFISNPTQDPCS